VKKIAPNIFDGFSGDRREKIGYIFINQNFTPSM